MNQNDDPPNKININSEDSTNLIKNVTVYDNLDQNLITITEDRLENILLKYLQNIGDKKGWHAPLGIFLSLILTISTTENLRIFFL
jgi:hypothetical protein